MCGFCVDDQMVIVPLPGSKCATTPRGSIAVGARRWFIMRCEMTTSACGERLVDRGVVDGWPSGLTPVPLGTSGTARLFGKVRVDDRRLAGHRQLGVDDGRQRLVRDHDRVGRVAGDVAIRGDDDGDRLACVAHHVDGDRAVRRARETACRSASAPRNSAILAPVKTASTPSIACGGAGVDRHDAAVRDVAALERQVLHAGDA